MKERISLYFYAGDFADVIRRYERGETQIYATHNEVAQLLIALDAGNFDVHVFSFITPEAKTSRPLANVTVHELGATRYDDPRVVPAFEENNARAAVLHFPHMGLLSAGAASAGRAFPILANSYNRRGPKAALERWRTARLLNNDKFRFVSNHCRPATEHLASFGVDRSRLIPWNIPMPNSPAGAPAKMRTNDGPPKLVYAGAIREDKGVGEIIEAVALLRSRGTDVTCSLAGGGEIEALKQKAAQLQVDDRVTFLGLVPNDKVISLFREADAVIVPSRRVYTEGFPLVMLEAIASRTPIICSDHPMFTPVMKDRETALVFKEGQANRLAVKIAELFRDDTLYARLSDNADASWSDLQRTADWRTMLFSWFTEGDQSPYLQRHVLDA